MTGSTTHQQVRDCPACQASINEHKALVKAVSPLYKEMLCSSPYYKAKEHDEYFWEQYVSSAVVSAQALLVNWSALDIPEAQKRLGCQSRSQLLRLVSSQQHMQTPPVSTL